MFQIKNKIFSKDEVLSITYSFVESPFGIVLVAALPEGVCYAAFVTKELSDKKPSELELKKSVVEMKKHFNKVPSVLYKEGTNSILKKALVYFRKYGSAKKRAVRKTEFPLCVIGTDFQIRVWKSLVEIPVGFLSVYTTIAKKVGKPKAVRAVGSAIGANPIALLIPCHRVIRSDGTMGGYHWGVTRKINIIEHEQ
jgi:AraC family transcriptional regulator of adaptative response/methylated-DNA-[protein]-cysteine methyltransferase